MGLGANPVPTPVVTVGGQTAAGVTEQTDGTWSQYYDVLFTVPYGLAAGPQPVVVSVAGVSAPTKTLYVGVALPSISAIENSATGTLQNSSHPAAPNSIVSIYAANAGNTTAIPSTYPITNVEGVQVLVNGTAVPIYALVPAAGHNQCTVTVRTSHHRHGGGVHRNRERYKFELYHRTGARRCRHLPHTIGSVSQ